MATHAHTTTVKPNEPSNPDTREGALGTALALIAAAPALAASPNPDDMLIRMAQWHERLGRAANADFPEGVDDDHPLAVAAEARRNRAWDEQAATVRQMMRLSPSTLDGFRAVAAALVVWKPELLTTRGLKDDGDRLAGLLLAGLLGRSIDAPEPARASWLSADAALLATCEGHAALFGRYDSLGREASPLPVGSERFSQLYEAMCNMVPDLEAAEEQIASTPAATLKGLRAKAHSLRRHLGGEEQAMEPMDGEDALAWSLTQDTLRLLDGVA